MTIYELSNQFFDLLEMLESGKIDEKTFNDTIESLGIENKVEDYCKVIAQMESDKIAIENEISRLESKNEKIVSSIERIKNIIKKFMIDTNNPKIKTNLFSVSLRKSEQVKIIDKGKIPQEYLRITSKSEPKKAEIKAAIKLGKTVAGCTIEENKSLQIK